LSQTYTNTDVGFTISYPGGWFKTEPSSAPGVGTLVMFRGTGTAVTILAEEAEAGMSLDESAHTQRLRLEVGGAVVQSPENTSLDGEPAVSLTFSRLQGKRTTQSTVVLVLHGGRLMTVLYGGFSYPWTVDLGTFHEMLNSFTWE